MKKSRSVRCKVRRRKVAQLAAYSRKYTVSNNTIPKAKPEDIIDIKYDWGIVKGTKGGEWKNPKNGFPQYKPMMKKHTELVYNKETHMTERVFVASTFPTKKFDDYQKKLWKNLGKAAKMEAYVQHKLKKWEKKNPRPVPEDAKQKDLFEEQFVRPWEAERDSALERIRDFVVSVYDKLPLTGRYKNANEKFVEKPVAEIKDINGEGHKINELDPKKSKLLEKAQKITNKEKAKKHNLVATNLKDHKHQRGRIILPKAA